MVEAPVVSRPIDSPHDIAKQRNKFRATKSTMEIEQRKPDIPIQGRKQVFGWERFGLRSFCLWLGILVEMLYCQFCVNESCLTLTKFALQIKWGACLPHLVSFFLFHRSFIFQASLVARANQFWITRSSVRSFARTAHSFACSALLDSISAVLRCIHLFARSFALSQACGKANLWREG